MKPWRAYAVFGLGALAVAGVDDYRRASALTAERAETARLRAAIGASLEPRPLAIGAATITSSRWTTSGSKLIPLLGDGLGVPSRTYASESTVVCSAPCRVVVPVYVVPRAHGAEHGAKRAPSPVER